MHNPQIAEGATLAQTTEMYINALEHPKVFMLGHTGRSGVPFDIDEVLLAAKAKHKIIEINNHSLEHGVDEIHFPLDLIVTRDRETLLREMAAAGVCDLRKGM